MIHNQRLRMALERIPYKNQEVIYMRYWKLLTIEEIAQQLSISWAQANKLIDTSCNILKKIYLNDFNRIGNETYRPRKGVKINE